MKTSETLFVAACLAVLMSGCDARQGFAQPPTPSEPRSMTEQLAELERTGALPPLDRSSDIAGPDADHNGIRDDIDAYIAALPVSEPVKKAARQVARVQQKSLLIDLNDRPALKALADASMASTSCMSDVSDVGATPQERYQSRRDGAAITFKIEAITANTPERAERYMAYMRALHGTTTESPFGNRCEDQ